MPNTVWVQRGVLTSGAEACFLYRKMRKVPDITAVLWNLKHQRVHLGIEARQLICDWLPTACSASKCTTFEAFSATLAKSLSMTGLATNEDMTAPKPYAI